MSPTRTPSEDALLDHVELLSDIMQGRRAGQFDTRTGSDDSDLLYALEEVVSNAPRVVDELKERGA